jgi:hypothetical protein
MMIGGCAMQDYADDIATLRSSQPGLAEELAGFNTLENVLNWMRDKGLSLAALDVIFQDEYSHDVLIPLNDEHGWLVFGIT